MIRRSALALVLLSLVVVNAAGAWPEGPQLIEKADGIVLYLGEGGRWAQEDPKRREAIRQFVARGWGLVALHWAIGAKDAKDIPGFLPWLGGMHGGPDRKYTFCETAVELAAREHPVLCGIDRFPLNDEFYYKLKFAAAGKVTPLLQAKIDGTLETCAWAFERSDGGRSFGFCGMHDHRNWRLVALRRLLAQAVLWSVNLPVPAAGLAVEVTEDDLKILPDETAAAGPGQQVGPGSRQDTVPVGVAKVDITPDQPVRMYGYRVRKTESEGIAGRLKASAMALGGDEGEGPAGYTRATAEPAR